MSTKLFPSLFAYKRWANRELFDLLKSVSHVESADADKRENVMHTSIRLLNHIYVVDRIFQAHLQGLPHDYEASNTKETPTLDTLAQAVDECDAWYESYVCDLDINTLQQEVSFVFTDGDIGRMTREEMLMHIITHGGYHRGNVGQLLKSIQVAPPRDIYTKFLHQLEPQRRQVS